MRAFERFLEYVKINTQSSETSGMHPSFKGEFDLANIIKNELIKLGVDNIYLDDKCYLYGDIKATPGYEEKAAIGFIAHMDTSPDALGECVNPVLHEKYDGSDVVYKAAGTVMRVSDFSELKSFIGQTLITSDGTTLLGSDDKAGIAEIITAIEYILTNNIPHGPIYIAFTPDEEIGEGADYFDLKRFKAKYAYTVDGGDVDTIEYENFNAASANITINGLSVHPGSAKNKMINALNVACELHMLLPVSERPESTEDREGFYHLTDLSGCCEKANMHYIIRDHDMDIFNNRKAKVLECVNAINQKYGDNTAVLELKDSYYNMKEKILPHMYIVEKAKKAIEKVGYIPKEIPIRGGTDGARLSYMGLPCPNLGTGGFNFHGPFEFNSVERMDAMVDIIVNIISID